MEYEIWESETMTKNCVYCGNEVKRGDAYVPIGDEVTYIECLECAEECYYNVGAEDK